MKMKTQPPARALLALLLSAAASLWGAEPPAPATAPAPATLEAILASLPADDGPVREQLAALSRLPAGDDAAREALLERLREQGAKAAPAGKVAIGGALMLLGEQKDGVALAETVVNDSQAPFARRLEAVAVMAAYGGEYAGTRLRWLQKNADASGLPPRLRVELSKGLWELSYDPAAAKQLQGFAFGAGVPAAARDAAVLALGRYGRYESNKADDPLRVALRELAQAPGDLGTEARLLRQLDSRHSKDVARDEFASRLLSEVVEKIRSRYAFDPNNAEEVEQIKPEKLATNAARALVRSLDDFSDYLDADDYQEMINSMHGDYGGIGAYVGMRNGFFTVLTPMYDKPAWKAGLRAMDIITKIDGEEIGKLGLDKIIKKLKGQPDTKVKVTVVRKGADEPFDVVVDRQIITMPMMFYRMLPGGIGYIRLTGFQEDPERRISTSSELKRALTALKKENVKGVILDLRNNPGGLLTEAVSVCENFLKRNLLVVFSKGTFQPRRNYVSKILGDPTFTGPLAVLINGGSASASEIVAGALRDHKRATLIGEKSFGKGSVQMLLPIETAANSRLKLTIAKYYLPSGECIHGRDKGIKPHVEVEEPKFSPAERELRLKQMENRDIAVWLEENFDKNKDAFMALLEFDGNDCSRYPGFDGLFKLLTEKYPNLKLDRETVRRELRANLFSFIRESRGIEGYPVDLMESDALKRAIVVIGEKIGGLPDVPVYNAFKDKWKEEDAKKAAEAKKAPAGAPADAAKPEAAPAAK